MATLKFDRILQEFSRRIGDRLVSSFTPGGGAFPNGTELDAVDAISYINKALHKLIDDVLEASKGDIKVLASAFPELVSTPTTAPFSGGEYTIASPHKDFFKLFGAYIDATTIIRVYDSDQYVNLKTANYPDYEPTTEDPCMVALNEQIYIFPTTITTAEILYIRKPLLPTTGDFIVQNGSVDSLYHDHRNSRLAEIAVQLYMLDKNPK